MCSPLRLSFTACAATLGGILLPLATLAQSTVFLDAGPGLPYILGLEGAPLAAGNRVSLGTYGSEFDSAVGSGDLFALAGAWREFGGTTTRSIFGQPGRFAAALTSEEPDFTGSLFYLWILETSGAAPVASDLSNVIAFGLFTSSDPAWQAPSTGSSTATLTTAQIDRVIWGAPVNTNFQLAVPGALIPEPAAATLHMGVLVLLLRACRRPHRT